MKPEVTDLLRKIRKHERDLLELRKARERLQQTKNPDPKLSKMIDDEIAQLEKN